MIKKYVKKPVEIEAVKWDGLNLNEIKDFVGDSLEYEIDDTNWRRGLESRGYGLPPTVIIRIKTLEGTMMASKGDYIIKGIHGEFYACKPDVFTETYEEVE